MQVKWAFLSFPGGLPFYEGPLLPLQRCREADKLVQRMLDCCDLKGASTSSKGRLNPRDKQRRRAKSGLEDAHADSPSSLRHLWHRRTVVHVLECVNSRGPREVITYEIS